MICLSPLSVFLAVAFILWVLRKEKPNKED